MKKFILKNLYTRGQVQLFIEGNNKYGFDQILDWMQYGDTSELETGRLDKILDVVMPRPASVTDSPAAVNSNSVAKSISKPISTPAWLPLASGNDQNRKVFSGAKPLPPLSTATPYSLMTGSRSQSAVRPSVSTAWRFVKIPFLLKIWKLGKKKN